MLKKSYSIEHLGMRDFKIVTNWSVFGIKFRTDVMQTQCIDGRYIYTVLPFKTRHEANRFIDYLKSK